MRTRHLSTLLGVVGSLAAMAPRAAHAQADTNPPLPNALLLVDTSGSMEYMVSPNAQGKPQLPVCNPGNPLLQNDQNRWTTMVDVLGGEVQNFSCLPSDRNSPAFKTEFGLAGGNPVDWNYYLKHNRIISNGCVMGPNQAAWPPATPGGVFDFPPNSLQSHNWSNPNQACNGFVQSSDGLLDAFSDRVRFALMTFDNNPDPGKGFFSGSGSPDFPTGVAGEWSYFPGWFAGAGAPAQGKPGGCNVTSVLEVGARNPAAPPWEGRAIGFGDPNASTAQIVTTNTQIQQALLAVRPYGATPIAGMLTDAQFFLKKEATTLPGQTTPFGPKDDPFVTGGCRKNFIILLTDGVPNMDLRPSCTSGATPPGGCPWEPGGVCPTGTCPYKLPEEVAFDLFHPTDGTQPIPTYVVGFAVSTVGPNGPAQVDCSVLTPSNSGTFDPSGKCANPTTDDLKACCTLGRIAFNGGTTNAFFADNKDALRKALSDILSNISPNATTRTWPTFGIASSGAGAAGFGFLSSFKVASGSLWEGVLERRRWLCQKDPATGLNTAVEKPVTNTEGDAFELNVNSGAGTPRHMYSVVPPQANGVVDMRQTIRGVPPGATVYNGAPPAIGPDGLGSTSGVMIQGDAAAFYNLFPPEALQVNLNPPIDSTCSTPTQHYTASQCRDLVMLFNLGLPSPSTKYKRDSVLGSIYHSTPTLIGAPRDFLRDESYINFQVQQKLRPTVLYTGTTDGQLHAFKVGPVNAADPAKVDSIQNNELWSFFPPGVVPGLRTLYPGVQQNLLDGIPVVRDIILRRNGAQAIAGGGAGSAVWSTILTAGFGPGFAGYFALDVTNPVPVQGDPKSGPKFLWQLSTDVGGKPVFGASTTPALATIVYNDGSGPAEVAVAILPGGDSAPSAPGNCAVSPAVPSIIDPGKPFSARGQIHCYAPDDPAKSVTVVRLDTGEVIRRFANPTGASPLSATLLARTTPTKLDSPMIGIPMPYPNGPGTITTRAFMGDRDGRMWRLDLSSTTPSLWKMELFADAFPVGLPGNVPGQPIVIPPALSVDQVGNPILYFATGSQDNFSGSDPRNTLWAVTERADIATGKLYGTPLWHLGYGEAVLGGGVGSDWTNGTRVTGPISVFNGTVYFATYRPPLQGAGAPVCSLADSTVWGVNYQRESFPGTYTPAAAFLAPSLGINSPLHGIVQASQLVFGIGVQRAPPCFDTTSFSDDFVGYGSQNVLPSNVSAGDFRLVWQTSPTGKPKAGDQQTTTTTVSLPPPPAGVRISSWASIVE